MISIYKKNHFVVRQGRWRYLTKLPLKILLLFYLLLCMIKGTASAQNISAIEYFINSDPGLGNATPVSFTPAPDVPDLNFQVELSALNIGFNQLFVRAKTHEGKWSLTNVKAFYKGQPFALNPDIVQAEYYFNSDPGFGNATNVPIPSSINISNFSFTADVSELPVGFNHMYFRTKDANGVWSHNNVKAFYKQHPFALNPDIVQAEYYFNTDPGFGNAINVPIPSSINISNFSFTTDVSELPVGFNHMYFRTKDANGLWSHTNVKAFYKGQHHTLNPDIVKAEYFFNTDPGFGNATDIPISPSAHVSNFSFFADISELPLGFNHLNIRMLDANGVWSHTNLKAFVIDRVHSQDIVEAEYFINTDPGFGQGNSVGVVNGPDVTLNFSFDISELATGTHRIFVRARDESGVWSLTNIYELMVLDIKVFLEGPFADGTMNSNLGSNIPLLQPFSPDLPWWGNPDPVWYYEGDETVEEIPQNVVDWILLELRETAGAASTATSDKIFWQTPAFLFDDGHVKSIDGETPVKLVHQARHDVYLVIHHRNHLSVMSAVPVNKETGFYDFTTALDKAFSVFERSAYLGGQKQLGTGIYGMFGGDGDANGQIQTQDKNNVWNPQSGLGGYHAGDFDLNGQVQTQDKNNIWNPNSGIGSSVP